MNTIANVQAAATSRPRPFTTKQMGDATEMLVAAELTLAGVPALKVPDMWPGYDVIAQPIGMPPQRISVKARTRTKANYIAYNCFDSFDWLAVVLMEPDTGTRSLYLIPRDKADEKARRDKATSKTAAQRYFTPGEIESDFRHYRNNSALNRNGDQAAPLQSLHG